MPIRPGAGSAYEKVERRAGDWAIAAAGTFVQLDATAPSRDCGIGLTAVGADHFTCAAAEDHLRGKPATAENFAAAAQICHDDCRPQADQRGPVDYKRHLARELTAPGAHPIRRPRPRRERLMEVTMTVNGQEVTREIEPRLLLVHLPARPPRVSPAPTGGATRRTAASAPSGSTARRSRAAPTLAAMAHGHEVRTVEDLEQNGALDPVQEGFMQEHGLQCGFCTPGMMMTGALAARSRPGPRRGDDPGVPSAATSAAAPATRTSCAAVRWAAEHPRRRP